MSDDMVPGEDRSFDDLLGDFVRRESARRARGRRAEQDVVAAISGRTRASAIRMPVAVAATGAVVIALVVAGVAFSGFLGLQASSSAAPGGSATFPIANDGLACPTTKGADLTSDLPAGSAFGDGPVHAVFAESAGKAFFDNDFGVWKRIDMVWVAEPGFSGQVVVRGEALRGHGEVSFGDAAEQVASSQVALDTSQAAPIGRSGWTLLAEMPMRVRGPGCYEIEIDTAKSSSVFVFEAGTVEDAWVQLARPLRLPSIASDESCPVTPLTRAVDFIGGGAAGGGPVYLLGGSGRVFWVADTRELGPILIRGGRIDGQGELNFGTEGSSGPILRLPVHSFVSSAGQPLGWRQFITVLLPSSPGCYALQVDTLSGSRTLVIELPN
jgi:hypothetical protein